MRRFSTATLVKPLTHRDANQFSTLAIQRDFGELAETAMAAVRSPEREDPDRSALTRIRLSSGACRFERDVLPTKLDCLIARDFG